MDLFNTKKIALLTEKLNNVSQTLLERDLLASSMGVSHDGKRNIYDIYGYPENTDFQLLYKYCRREGIANRIVFGLPISCWRDGFSLFLDEEKEKELIKEELHQINKKLLPAVERADALNRIGKFSCLYVGVPDMQDPREPVGKVRGDAIKSLYFRPFAYDGVTIFKWDMDVLSPRFGLPELYQLQVIGRGENTKDASRKTIIAHYTRVVHLCETKFDSEVEGLPALEPVFNNILNIEKATGGSAEAYFRNARGKTSFEIDPEFSTELINNEAAKNKFDESAKKFTNDWQDQIIAIGAKVTSHNSPHASPLDTVKVNLWQISTQTKLKIRVLTGEGSGQLAGSEDKMAYDVLVDDRQESFCSEVVHSAMDILNMAGVVNVPEEYYILWPKEEPTTEMQQAEIGVKKSQTIKNLTDAKSSIGGDGLDIESAFEGCYLSDIEVEESEISLEPEVTPEEEAEAPAPEAEEAPADD